MLKNVLEVTKDDMRSYINDIVDEIVIHEIKKMDLYALLNQAMRELEAM